MLISSTYRWNFLWSISFSVYKSSRPFSNLVLKSASMFCNTWMFNIFVYMCAFSHLFFHQEKVFLWPYFVFLILQGISDWHVLFCYGLFNLWFLYLRLLKKGGKDKIHKRMPHAKCYYVLWKYVCICVGLFACVYVCGTVLMFVI